MSTLDAGYNPLGYHHGTVWPHDNSIIAAGLARYGFRDEANRITLALLDAAACSAYRLPEALSGHPRESEPFPVRYPTACSPQAWASGAPLLCLRSMLGANVRAQQVEVDPCIPDEIGEIVIDGLHALGTRWHIEAIGTNGHVRLAR
jgi:glycogen debranching enzyme